MTEPGGGWGYDGSNWVQASGGAGGSGIIIVRYQLPKGVAYATGGNLVIANGYRIHTITNSQDFVVTSRGDADVLLIAGGGSGGAGSGGGGGAGGVVYTNIVLPVGTNHIVIGQGGPAMGDEQMGTNGENSVFCWMTAYGGGGGGKLRENGLAGGSGGGGGGWNNELYIGGVSTASQGYEGGTNIQNASYYYCGGGGGGAGGTAVFNGDLGSDGGIGLLTDISGSNVYYAGGGGGGIRHTSDKSGDGGLGGGGDGGYHYNHLPISGTPNTGGGGGGGGYGYDGAAWIQASGAAGGSGILIVRYALPKGTMILVR